MMNGFLLSVDIELKCSAQFLVSSWNVNLKVEWPKVHRPPTSPELRTKLFETNLLNLDHMTTDQLKPAQKLLT